MAVETAGDFRVFWMLGVLTCCLFTNTNGQGVSNLQIDSTTSFGFEISWTVLGAWDYYVIIASLGPGEEAPGEEAPGYPMNTTSTSAQLIHLYPDTAYEIVVLPKLNDGEEGPWDSTSGTTDVSRIQVKVISETIVRVAYTLPEDEPSSDQKISLGHFGSILYSYGTGHPPVNNMGNVLFTPFPAVSPGDLLYASNSPWAHPSNYLNEIHFRYPPSPPQNVTINPSPGDAFEVTFELPATGGNYDGFKIRVNDEVWETLMGSATTSVIINGLAPNTPYTFDVTSFVGIGGDEAESEIFSDTRILVNFNLIQREETVLGLSWGQPEGMDYDSLRLEASFGLNSRPIDLAAESLAYNFTQLTPGTEHTVSLFKKMGNVIGDLVTRNTFQTLPATLDASTITFSVEENGDLVLNWRVPLGVVDYYEVTVTPGDLVLNITSTTYTFSSLDPSTIYTFSIKTFTSGFESTGTATENRFTGPAAPEGIEITGYSAGAYIAWTAVPKAEVYRVILKNSSGDTLSDGTYDEPIFEPQDLEEATSYSVSITSIDTNGIPGVELTGRTSIMNFTTITRFAEVTSRTGDSITLGSLTEGDEVSAVGGASVLADVLGNAIIFALSPARCYRIEVARSLDLIYFFEECTLPDPPSLTVQRGSPTDSLLLLNITAPSSSSELVTYAVTGGGSDVPQTVTDISLPIPFSGLEPYTNYTFTVVSVFMNLESSEVTESESTALSSPLNFEATLTTYTEITLEWTAVPNAATYILSRNPGSRQVMPNQPSHTFTGLTPGRTYSFSIISSRAGDFDSEEVTIDACTEEIPAGVLLVSGVTSEKARIQWRAYEGVSIYEMTFDPVDAVQPNNGIFSTSTNLVIYTPGGIINVTLRDAINNIDALAFTQLRSGPGSPIGSLDISGSILTANITWISPASPHDGFEVYITNLDLPSGERILKETLSNNPGFYIVTGLIPGTTFEIEVGTYLDSVEMFPLQRSEQSINLRNNITTDVPVSPMIFEIDRNETAIVYSIGAFEGAEVALSPNGDWMGSYKPPHTVFITNLLPGQLYKGTITTDEILPIQFRLRPSMPDVTVLNTMESSIALGLQPGHGVLDEYIITIECMDASQDHCVCEEEHRVSGNAKTFVIDDLRPSVEYGISVVAWAGSELAENSVEVTLEERTLWIPVNRLTILDQTPDSVILVWTVSGPANITMERLMPSGYVLNATYVYDGCFSSNVLEVSGLEPVTIYRFTMPDDVSILIRTDPPSIESCSVETTSSGYTFTWSALAPGSNDGYQVTVTDSQGGLVQEEAVPPTDDPEVVKIRVPPETKLTLAVNSLLAADDTNNFPQQFGAVPCIQNAVTKSLVPGEVSSTSVTIDEIRFVVGNAGALQGFEAYAFAIEPPGPVISFNADSLTGVYSNVIPGQLYTITSTIVGTDATFTLMERAKPLPPVDGSSPAAGVTSVRLQWGTPSGIVTFYRVTINPTLDTDQNFIVVTNLLPGTDYNVSIVAISGTGLYQQISDPIEFQVITDNLTTGELVFVDVTSSSMTAIWRDSGSPSYTPIILIGTETNSLSSPSPDGNVLIVTDGVKSSQIYHFTIYDSLFAVVANNSVRTNPETPQPPILTSVGPFNLSFEWAPTNTTFSSYRMYNAPFSFRRELVSTIPSNSLDLTYSQGCLRPNTEYVFEVETVLNAADGFGEQTSDSAQSISITTSQYDNNEPHVSSTNNTNLQVIWLNAATNGLQVCLKELCSNLQGDTLMCLPTNQTCPLFYTFEGLVPGRRYVVYVEYNDGTMEDVIFTPTIPTTTSSPTVSSPPKSTCAGGSSISIVVGSAVGAILVIVVVIALIIILYKRRSNESATSKSEGRESKSPPRYDNPVFDQSQTEAHTYQDLNTIRTYQDCNNDDQSYDDTVDPHTYQEPDQEANYEEVNDAKEKNYVNGTMIKQKKV